MAQGYESDDSVEFYAIPDTLDDHMLNDLDRIRGDVARRVCTKDVTFVGTWRDEGLPWEDFVDGEFKNELSRVLTLTSAGRFTDNYHSVFEDDDGGNETTITKQASGTYRWDPAEDESYGFLELLCEGRERVVRSKNAVHIEFAEAAGNLVTINIGRTVRKKTIAVAAISDVVVPTSLSTR